jgi:NAD(P)-dependent dehydrogenase (short-subunit alcohol dehydrogenase family)
VTGANGDIGVELVKQLSATHHTVWLGARSEENGKAAEAKARLEAKAENIHFVQCDTCSDDSVKACVKHIEEVSGRLDLLVNNAGIGGFHRMQVCLFL